MNARFFKSDRFSLSLAMLFLAAQITYGQKSASEEISVRQGPKILVPGEHGVGGLIADVKFTDIRGVKHSLVDLSKKKAIVVAMTSTSCPLSKKYLPTLADMVGLYSKHDVAFLLVNTIKTDKLADMQDALDLLGHDAIYVSDSDSELVRSVRATSTTDVVVLDSARTVVYHGAVDDQYGFGYSTDAPKNRYLAEAIDAVLKGEQPTIEATAAPGCVIDTTVSSSNVENQTYYANISRLIQRHCIECHRDGGVAPFSLDSYDDVVAHAPMIQDVVTRGIMPPWFAASNSKDPVSPWANDRSLAATEKRELLSWLSSDHRKGDPKNAPILRGFSGEWTIGTPELIVQLPKPISIKASGTMPYQFVTAQTTLSEDRWVQAYEILPTDRSVVHHVIVNVHVKGSGRIRDREEGIGGYWAAYVPGNTFQVYPPGFARKLPAGATVSFQIHYTPNGKATQDQLRIGLIFAKDPPNYAVETFALADRDINIPPGKSDHIESTSRRIPRDINVLAYMAHMHVRGKSFKYELTTPDGNRETLLDIPHYDFNWQLRYDYADPRVIPAGSTVKVTAAFDNSDKNPANPDSTKTVRWGPQTFDEMMIGYVETYRALNDSAEATEQDSPGPLARLSEVSLRAIFDRMDRNGDGKVSSEEVPESQRQRLMRLDTNSDGAISMEEAERLKDLRKRIP